MRTYVRTYVRTYAKQGLETVVSLGEMLVSAAEAVEIAVSLSNVFRRGHNRPADRLRFTNGFQRISTNSSDVRPIC